MSLYYSLTPEQFKKLVKNSNPRSMNDRERASLKIFNEQLENSFKK